VVPLGAINGSERLRGIDLSRCETVTTVKDVEKDSDGKVPEAKGWQRFGYDDQKLPRFHVEICEAQTAENECVKERLQNYNGFKERGKASDTVCASEFALLSAFVRSVACTCVLLHISARCQEM
jgi:hypothetical protein